MRKSGFRIWVASLAAGAVVLGGGALAGPAIAATTTATAAVTTTTTTASPTLTAKAAPLKTGSTCATAAKPVRQVTNYYDDPNSKKWDIPTNVAKIICDAKPGSTINVAVYFLSNQSEASKIIAALTYMHKKHNVKLHFVYDKRPKSSDYYTPVKLVKQLKKIGTVVSCHQGCLSARGGNSTFHVKFLTISNMKWAGVDPTVIDMSSNWDNRQFEDYWQVATVVYDNAKLTAAYNSRYAVYLKCAKTNKKCTGAPSNFARSANGTLVDTDKSVVVPGDAKTGLSVFFAPLDNGVDPLLEKLDSLKCVSGSTIHLAMFYFSDSRGLAAAKQLAKLSKEGCKIKIVLSGPTGRPDFTSKKIRSTMSKANVSVHCTGLVHEKLWLFKTKGYQSFWAGSSNVGLSDTIANDESQLIGVVGQASGKYRTQMKATMRLQEKHFEQVFSAKSRSCNP